MPRYFFHIHDGISVPDKEGTDLLNWEDAQEQAIRYAGSIIADNAKTTKLGEDWTMVVTDEEGIVLFRLDFHVSSAATTRKLA